MLTLVSFCQGPPKKLIDFVTELIDLFKADGDL